jgi:hypothetical protein
MPLSGLGDSIEVLVTDVAGGAEYYDSKVRVKPGSSPVNIIMVPRQWKIEAGRFAGEWVAISLAAAFEKPCSARSINCDAFFPMAWLDTVQMWSKYPVVVALDHARSNQPLVAEDSTRISESISQLNVALGRTALTFGRTIGASVVSDSVFVDRISIRVDTNLLYYGGFTTWWSDSNGRIVSSLLRGITADTLKNSVLVQHELLHSLGFRHTCAWASIMGGYGCAVAPGLTSTDVAYVQLAIAFYNAVINGHARSSMETFAKSGTVLKGLQFSERPTRRSGPRSY